MFRLLPSALRTNFRMSSKSWALWQDGGAPAVSDDYYDDGKSVDEDRLEKLKQAIYHF